MRYWETPTCPDIGDVGQLDEYDAEVASVNFENGTVEIVVYDEVPYYTEIEYLIL